MSLTLSSTDLEQLAVALSVVTSPLSYDDVGAWRRASRGAVGSLLGAFEAVSWLPLEGEPLVQVSEFGAMVVMQAQAQFPRVDPGINTWRQTKVEIADFPQIYPLHEPAVRAWYQDVVLPLGLQNSLFLISDVGADQPAALIFNLPAEGADARRARGIALLRLVRPAFQAGALHCIRLTRQRQLLGRLVDALPDGLALCDAGGRIVHRNPALAAILAADGAPPRLVEEITRAAASTAALAERRRRKSASLDPADTVARREVRTAVGRYRVNASYVGHELLGPETAVVVLVARVGERELDAAELRARYRLTPREIQVTYLLARGRSNAEVARTLGLSPSTTHHYTDNVLTKLGLRSRAGVAAKLQTDAPVS